MPTDLPPGDEQTHWWLPVAESEHRTTWECRRCHETRTTPLHGKPPRERCAR